MSYPKGISRKALADLQKINKPNKNIFITYLKQNKKHYSDYALW